MEIVRIACAAALLASTWGCREAPRQGTPAARDPSLDARTTPTTPAPPPSVKVPVPVTVGTIDAGVVDAGGARAPLPALDEVSALELEQHQGGPRAVSCKGVVYRLTIDLVQVKVSSGVCQSATPGIEAAPDAPLTWTRHALASPDRARIADAYARLTHGPATGCGHDGGTLALVVTTKAGATLRFVDQNWGCRKPPPEVADGLAAFANQVTALLMR
jgi:hypothetical protein